MIFIHSQMSHHGNHAAAGARQAAVALYTGKS